MLTIYMENLEIPVGKSNGMHHSIWSISEIMGFWSKRCTFIAPLGFTVDVHTSCMLSIFREDKLNHFIFMPKISIRVVCVNGKHTKRQMENLDWQRKN